MVKVTALYATEEQLQELIDGERKTIDLETGPESYVSIALTDDESKAPEWER